MPAERPRIDLSPLQIALAIMLAIAGGIQTWNNFNNGMTDRVATLTERVAGLQRQVDELRDEVREELRRGRSDGGQRH